MSTLKVNTLNPSTGNDIAISATDDVNIPANVGLTFGDDGEKIEGDGTNLTISGNKIKLESTVISGSATSTGSFGRVTGDGSVLTGVATPASVSSSFAASEAVSSSFAQKSAVSSSFAQKSAVSGSLGLVTGLNTGTTVISGSSISTGSFGLLQVDGANFTSASLAHPAAAGAAAITAIAGTAANQLLTDDGDGTVTSEANITYNGTTFTVTDQFSMGSGTGGQFTETARGAANWDSEDWKSLADVGAATDGVWLTFGMSAGVAHHSHGIIWYSANEGATRERAHWGGGGVSSRWNNDFIQVQQDTGTDAVPVYWVVYRMQKNDYTI